MNVPLYLIFIIFDIYLCKAARNINSLIIDLHVCVPAVAF